MKHTFVASAVALALGALVTQNAPLGAQTNTTAGLRGKVLDEKGVPIPEVKVDFEFKGESRVKVTKSQLTDKKGGFVRVGLSSGKWKLSFAKEGFAPYSMETDISAGGYSEIPDVVLKAGAAPAAAAAPAANESVPNLPTEAVGTMKDVYNKAVEASRAGNLDDAERFYKEILEKLPDLAEVHYNLAYVYVRKNDLDSAEAAFKKAAELKPQRADAFIALGALYGTRGKTKEGADLMLAAAPNFEQDARFQFVLGTTCVNAGQSPAAATAFRKVIALDPNNAEPHFYLGTIAVGENKVADALAELQKYVAASGQDPQNLATAKKLIDVLKPKK
jgi:cytochrome c-type biogenesis protein CcmH/NrfG